jgi:hypothetical protein
MGNPLKTCGPFFRYGNFLGDKTSQTDAPIVTPKRVNESALENQPKRQRTDDDAGHDIHSTTSNSGLPEKSGTAGSPHSKGAREAPSLRSSADTSANGRGLEEYRSTQHRVDVGKNIRPRRKNKARQRPDEVADDGDEVCWQKTSSTGPYKTRKPLMSLKRPSDDPIQDDEEDIEEIEGPIARKPVINGRSSAKAATSNASFTSATFRISDVSEDELNAHHPPPSNPRSQKRSQVSSGRKRPVGIEVDDGAETLPSAKRRTQAVDRADMHRTTFASAAARLGDARGGLRVFKAVCAPTHVYPVEEDLHGADRKGCVLLPNSTANSLFQAVDGETRKPMAELLWLTPRASKVTQIACARNSMIVKISKRAEKGKDFNTGPSLYLQFGNAHEAEQFVGRFYNVNGITIQDNLNM